MKRAPPAHKQTLQHCQVNRDQVFVDLMAALELWPERRTDIQNAIIASIRKQALRLFLEGGHGPAGLTNGAVPDRLAKELNQELCNMSGKNST